MYAIIPLAGRQHRVEPGDTLFVDRLSREPGDDFEIAPLMAANGDTRALDGDALAKIAVKATVVEHVRGPKLVIFKYTAKKHTKRKKGFRAAQTRVKITDITGL